MGLSWLARVLAAGGAVAALLAATGCRDAVLDGLELGIESSASEILSSLLTSLAQAVFEVGSQLTTT